MKGHSLGKAALVVAALLAICGSSALAQSRQQISMWFWGAEPYAQKAFNQILVDTYNKSQSKYELKIEFRNSVDKDISVALAANQGPDIVYGSGPSFIMPLANARKLEPLDKYAAKYGWKQRILSPYYDSGTVKGKLYSLANSITTMGIFYNKKVLADNGWKVPTTIAELEKIMDAAIAKGMYASVTGNKGWKPVNENYASVFLNNFAGPDTIYKCLKGEMKWNNPQVVAAIDKSAEWYQKGYLGGKDYVNLNFSESIQLLADGKAPFFIGPSIIYQWAPNFFTGDKLNDLGFVAFPSGSDKVAYPTYLLGVACTFSINASSKNKDEAARIIDMMMQPSFMQKMTEAWPGYWGVPLKDLSSVDSSKMGPLSKSFLETVKDVSQAIQKGNFGYYSSVFFPVATQEVFRDIEMVWNKQATAEELLAKADTEFAKELKKGLVPPIPKAGR